VSSIDPEHWLYKHTPREWIHASLGELTQARNAFERKNGRAGLAGCRRAAGVAINGLLALKDVADERYGRSYMDHLAGLARDSETIAPVQQAADLLLQSPMPGGEVVVLRTVRSDERLIDAAETIMAHCLAMVIKNEP
jgi:hypothetical protein